MNFTACQHRKALSVRSEYLDANYLASKRIETPDPCQGCFVGQQVVISWHIPSRCLPAEIDLWVRYGNRCFTKVTHTVCEPAGFWAYRVMNEDFWNLKGIVAYSATLRQGDREIDQWNHHLWADLVEVIDESKDQISLLIPPPASTLDF
ncbi:MAG: hypothetical protein JSR97_03375 [Verrucomicrobia bacterium]|nr:hypothetical protein [Verrucomicrobiota bacterium]